GSNMTKPAIARLFFGSLVAIIGGFVLLGVAAIWAFGAGLIVVNETGVVLGGTGLVGNLGLIVLMIVGGAIALLVGGIGQFVAWIAAMVNTSHLDDKTWFVLLLVLGLFSLGFVAMLVYVLAGPDGLDIERRQIAGPAGGAA
ncbi:MAG TPA: hypothetical protein VFJ71_11340, partial [Candidatus Limnocylindrales bacterium]|nr:hypothetical protein [Candidatus Limnocylindrales bacterium]